MGDDSALAGAVESMLASNRPASEAALAHGVRCATDVTGFGLLGHLRELAAASGLEAVVDAGRVPALPERSGARRAGARPRRGRPQPRLPDGGVDVDAAVPAAVRTLLVDPQTSGGLLLAVAPSGRDALLGALRAAGADAAEVGMLCDGPAGHIRVTATPPAG